MLKERLERIDGNNTLRNELLPYCRLRYGQTWEDPECGHRIACLDAANEVHTELLLADNKAALAVQDPPYNVAVGSVNSTNLSRIPVQDYVDWSRRWVSNTSRILRGDASLYVWLGADQNAGFQPLADFIIMMRTFTEFKTRSLITMRNQRGYGTQSNWMAVRQELLYYTRGQAEFNVDAEYTDIPKILRGYYKKVNGQIMENLERSRSENIRAGNVWVDIQQVFYRMEENVPGCYAQKPLKAIERIIAASSNDGRQPLWTSSRTPAQRSLVARNLRDGASLVMSTRSLRRSPCDGWNDIEKRAKQDGNRTIRFRKCLSPTNRARPTRNMWPMRRSPHKVFLTPSTWGIDRETHGETQGGIGQADR